MRSVVLTEADFNSNNKVLERRAIQCAEKLNNIAPEQYGSRKHKSAIDQAIYTRITYDIKRQTKLPGAIIHFTNNLLVKTFLEIIMQTD